MWRWVQCLAAAVIGLVLVGAFPLATAGADDQAPHDALMVFCLTPDRYVPLVQAATTLHLVRPADRPDHLSVLSGPDVGNLQNLTPQAWSAARPAAFDRACQALATASGLNTSAPTPLAAAPQSGHSLSDVLIDLVPVAAGALLAWLSGELRARGAAATQQAEALHRAGAAYNRVCTTFLDAWTRVPLLTRPSDLAISERRVDVAAELDRCAKGHRGWTLPRLLAAELDTLNETLVTRGWVGITESERTSSATTLQGRLTEFSARLGDLQRAVERPWRLHRDMRLDQYAGIGALPDASPAPEEIES